MCLQCRRPRFDPWVGKIPWRRERLPTPVFWPGEFHGLYSPWGLKESDTTERLLFHFTSFIIKPSVQFSSVTQSCPTLCDPMDCSLPGSSVHGDSPDKNTGVGSHSLLQGIFPTQGSNPGLPRCGWILYHLSHHGSLRILEWVVIPFSRGSSQPKDRT